MMHPTFAGAYRVRRTGGPADESDEEDERSIHGRAYERTPFPTQQQLGSFRSEDSPPIIPGGRHYRSASNPTPSPFPAAPPGSGFGSPIGSPESVEHGPYQPPQPHILPAKSAMRRSNRRTMDGFGSPPLGFPQADQLPPPGANPYMMGPNGPYLPQQIPYGYAGQQPMPQSAPLFGMQPPYMGPTPRSMSMNPMPTPSMGTGFPFPMPGGPGQMMSPGMMMPQPGIRPDPSDPVYQQMPPGYPPGMPPGRMMPQPGMRSMLSEPPYQQIPDSYRGHRRRRRRRGDSDSSASSEEGIVPEPRYGGNANPLPQPPRALPVPAVSPHGSILVDSPPATGVAFDAPPIPPKPPPNPLPVPPKAVIEDAAKSDALKAAAEDVKRAKERTERARDKAIARLEADTWEAAGVPIGVTENGERHVPLIPGVTAPAVYSNVGKNKRRGSADEGDGEHHNPLGGLTSLLKRMSTRHRSEGPPPPVAPKPAKPPRESKQYPPRPMMPTQNSGDMPRDEGVFPRGVGLGGSVSISHLPFATELGPVVNGKQFAYPHTPGIQTPMQYDSRTQEYFDPSNGLWWNPNTRKYYNRRAATVSTVPLKGAGRDKEEGGGLRSMIKRWTTNTAPDHQPKPITAQLVLPTQPGATAGLKGVKAVGTVPPIRKSMQQQQRINIYPDHQHALSNGRPRTNSAVESRRGTIPWSFPPNTANTTPGDQPGVMPTGGPNGWHRGLTPAAMAAAAASVSQVPAANVYFSRKTDVYGGFRLDSNHLVSWGGVDGATALHWFESGRFENIGTGLGAQGMGSGWTFPSTMGLRAGVGGSGSGGKASRFFKVLGKGGDEGLKKSKLEYVRARTEESEHIMGLRTSREIQLASTNAQLEGSERRDWQQMWRTKLEEILYLKFQQHPDLQNLLVRTRNAEIIFNHEDSILGDGGNVNGASGNGENELGKALMRVRYTITEQLIQEQEE